MTAARKMIAGLDDLRVFPHAVTRQTAKELFDLNGDAVYVPGSNRW